MTKKDFLNLFAPMHTCQICQFPSFYDTCKSCTKDLAKAIELQIQQEGQIKALDQFAELLEDEFADLTEEEKQIVLKSFDDFQEDELKFE